MISIKKYILYLFLVTASLFILMLNLNTNVDYKIKDIAYDDDDDVDYGFNYEYVEKTGNEFKRIHNNSIFCMIFTEELMTTKKAQAVVDTWANECDKYIFIEKISKDPYKIEATEVNETFPILELPTNYFKSPTHKVYLTYREISMRYSGYDWYIRADDDTFVFMKNLKDFLKDQNPLDLITFGYDIKLHHIKSVYHSGGAGYVISSSAFHKIGFVLLARYEFCYAKTGWDDIDSSYCLRELDVKPGKSIDSNGRERFHLLDVRAHYTGDFPDWLYDEAVNELKEGDACCSDTTISFHYMDPYNMRHLGSLWKEYQANNNTNKSFIEIIQKMSELQKLDTNKNNRNKGFS